MAQTTTTFTGDGDLAILFSDRSDWAGGFAEDLSITAQGPATLQGWTLSFTLDDDIQQIWGATIISHVGNDYVLGNVGYNAAVRAGAPAGFGFVAAGTASAAPSRVVLDGAVFTQSAPIVAPIPIPVAAPVAAPVVSTMPGVSVANATVSAMSQPLAPAGPGYLLPSGYLSTSGSQIVDSQGAAVQINAINWFGMETSGFAPQGLDTVNDEATMQQMVRLGFNAIRIPFSLQSLDPSSMPTDIDTTLNPDLAGLNALGVLDRIVAEAGALGLKIILDDHSSAAGSGPNPDGLWYDGGYTPAEFTRDWVSLAGHYANNATVIGFDLSNEPHGAATWGDGNAATDWELAATQTGDAVQQVDPNALIIVEGVQTTAGVSTDWGGNLAGVAAHPVDLAVADRLVYSVHDYPSSVTGDSASDVTADLAATWTQNWGYIQQQNVAPVLMGEFGSTLASTSDQAWMNTLVQYLAGDAVAGTTAAVVSQTPVSWAYWDWNPDSNDTGGILLGDWTTPDATRLAAIAPALWKPSADGSDTANFALDLSSPATTAVTLAVQTVDGTAHAGADYVPLSETVVIAAGATTAEVSVQLLDSSSQSASSMFFLRISGASGATIAGSEASATLPAATPVTATAIPIPAPTPTPVASVMPTPVVAPAPIPVAVVTPAPAPAPIPAVAGVSGTAIFAVTNDWGSGLTASVTIANTASSALTGWQVELDTTEQITNLWNGVILSHVGRAYVVGNASYDGGIGAGGSASFGFQATHVMAGETVMAQLLKTT